ncbi:hypothetical protein [Tropicibacter naphthalenivorans]|uniref:Alginate biosynthesis protein Alg44 n=1 Tax=Tropicibacter naphthalenivorans TaxID=441103 RepID=A0A0P1GVB2_9RHOB|nr:hypothetical protein [Tropicibacter naphthalenivorans]CUH80072.1 hypothetical protein TRN7648_02792 [Tropicibacter naphthalenivorans]SMC84303.1 hypothetical protein SAMN04488093_10561 [Tropicibacter naphthalenivorans]
MSEVHTNTADLPPDFILDSEHPQVRLPFTVILGQRQLRGESLSVAKAVATGLVNRAKDGNTGPATLRFDLEGFAVSMPVDVRLQVADASEDAQVVLHFTNPTGPHLPVLRYILNSYISGDVVSVGGMLNYTGPVKIKPAVAKSRPGLLSRAATLGRKAVVLALTVGLIAVAGNILHDRVVFAYEPRPVKLVQDGQIMRATTGGQISYVDAEAAEGEVVYSLLSNSGDLLSFRMPCDCALEPTDAFAMGSTVMPGAPLVRLVDQSGDLTATTEITFDGTARLLAGDQPELVLADGRVVPVGLELLVSDQGSGSGQPVSVILPEGADLAAGDSARLRFERQMFGPLRETLGAWIAAAQARMAG